MVISQFVVFRIELRSFWSLSIWWNKVISHFFFETWSFLNLWNTVFFQFCGTCSFLHFSWFGGTWSFLNLLYLGLSLGVEGFDLCLFVGTWSFLNFMELGHSQFGGIESFFNSVEHGHFYMFPDILEHGHFSI